MIKAIHHIAIICSNYEASKHFYTQILGLSIIAETYRETRCSYKLDLAINDHYCIELFSFPDPPARPSYPEAAGLRHLAFAVDDIEGMHRLLSGLVKKAEEILIDELTGKQFFFTEDPDGLPIEFYQR